MKSSFFLPGIAPDVARSAHAFVARFLEPLVQFILILNRVGCRKRHSSAQKELGSFAYDAGGRRCRPGSARSLVIASLTTSCVPIIALPRKGRLTNLSEEAVANTLVLSPSEIRSKKSSNDSCTHSFKLAFRAEPFTPKAPFSRHRHCRDLSTLRGGVQTFGDKT